MEVKLGATGKHPKGKLNEDDAGELVMSIDIEKDNVRLNFGTSVSWFAMPPDLAIILGEELIQQAQKIIKDQK